jgi:LmbE family N-acetylglucosaminyl deacetylase
MIGLSFFDEKPLNILCLGAHCDDIEIGCGGTLLKIFDAYPIESVSWIVFCSTDKRKQEAQASANIFLESVKNKKILIKNFRDGFLPYDGYQVKESFEKIKNDISPDLIFTHYRDDLHQDHRKINELTWNTFRNHLIFEYEILKYDGDIGRPNFYFKIESEVMDKKNNIIIKSFKSQSKKPWFNKNTFQSIMRIRGVEASSPSQFAEAFYTRKIVV